MSVFPHLLVSDNAATANIRLLSPPDQEATVTFLLTGKGAAAGDSLRVPPRGPTAPTGIVRAATTAIVAATTAAAIVAITHTPDA